MGEEIRNSMRSGDQQLQKMKKQILQLLPEMADQIAHMEKKDLQEVLDMIGGQGQPTSRQPTSKEHGNKRDSMIRLIIKTFPDMKEEVQALDDKDIEEIYNQISIQNQSDAKAQAQASQRESQEVRKRKQFENGEINVYEMKKTLVDRLPEYRTQIRNLSEDQIKKMFRQLKAEDARNSQKNLRRPESSDNLPRPFDDEEDDHFDYNNSKMPGPPPPNQTRDIFPRKRGRPKKYKEPFQDSRNDNYGQKGYDFTDYNNPNYSNAAEVFHNEDFSNFEQSNLDNFNVNKNNKNDSLYENHTATYNPAKQVQINMGNTSQMPSHIGSVPKVHISSMPPKQTAKLLKHKHKCKVTFYLDSQDFEQQSDKNLVSSERRKNGLAKIIEGLSRAFGKVKQASQTIQNDIKSEKGEKDLFSDKNQNEKNEKSGKNLEQNKNSIIPQ